MTKYKKGDIVDAKVTSIEKYGAFAALDEEYSGLIHISEITTDFVKDVSSFLEIGEIIKVKILDIPEYKNQLKLSAKAVEDNSIHKTNKKKIQETVFGFYLLKSSLPGWISKKMEEINKNS